MPRRASIARSSRHAATPPATPTRGAAPGARGRGAAPAAAQLIARLAALAATPLASLFLAGTALAGPTTFDAPEQAEANFVFAHRLGSGIYELSGRTLQIYRLPLEWPLRDPTPARPGLTLTLPVTLGFFDFRVRDVIEVDLPSSISTVSVVPGLRWSYRLDDYWKVEPFAEAGIARDNGSDLQATVGTVGLRTEWRGESRWGAARYVGAASYAYADARGLPTDDFALITHSVEVARPLAVRPRGRALQYLPYASLRWYADPPSAPLTAATPRGNRTARLQLEVGVTFGTVAPLRIGRVALPPIGFGYRAGENLSVFRLVIGQPF